MEEPEAEPQDMKLVSRKLVEHIPAPAGDANDPLQLLVSSIDYSPYLGRLGIGDPAARQDAGRQWVKPVLPRD